MIRKMLYAFACALVVTLTATAAIRRDPQKVPSFTTSPACSKKDRQTNESHGKSPERRL